MYIFEIDLTEVAAKTKPKQHLDSDALNQLVHSEAWRATASTHLQEAAQRLIDRQRALAAQQSTPILDRDITAGHYGSGTALAIARTQSPESAVRALASRVSEDFQRLVADVSFDANTRFIYNPGYRTITKQQVHG